jgi:NAD-dependent dihydropyrimidine dehydrogenase PreA subunit
MNGRSLAIDDGKCVSCGICIDVCPHGVLAFGEGRVRVDAIERCMECGACAMNCPTGALTVDSGVGCAYAVIRGALQGTAPDCGCGKGDCCT